MAQTIIRLVNSLGSLRVDKYVQFLGSNVPDSDIVSLKLLEEGNSGFGRSGLDFLQSAVLVFAESHLLLVKLIELGLLLADLHYLDFRT